MDTLSTNENTSAINNQDAKENLLIVSYSYRPRLSGVGSIVDNLAKNFLATKKFNKVTVLSFQDYPELSEYETIEGIEIVRFKCMSLFGGRIPIVGLDFIKKHIKILQDPNIKQVHNHTRFAFSSFISLMISKFKDKKVIHFEHLSDFISGEPWFINTASFMWDQIVSRTIFALSDKIVCASHSMRTFITSSLGADPSKTYVVENGSNLSPSLVDYEAKFGNKKFFNIFFAARFVPLKNPILTLEAIKILAGRIKNFHFYMAGDGKLRPKVEQFIIDNNLSNRVTYLGKLSKSEMKSGFERSDIFLNPSRLEGFCGTVLEALYNTNMCVLSDVGGNRDIITVPECLIPLSKLTPKSLADRIENLIENKDRLYPQFQNDKDLAVKEYTWKNVLLKLDNVLDTDNLKSDKNLSNVSLRNLFEITAYNLLSVVALYFAKDTFTESSKFIYFILVALFININLPVLGFCLGNTLGPISRFFSKIHILYSYWIYLLIGIFSLNLPYILSANLNWNGYIATLGWILIANILLLAFRLSSINGAEVIKENNLNRYLKPGLIFLFVLGLASVLYYHLSWYYRLDWMSREFDLYQNYHLGRFFDKGNYALFGEQITPMFNITTYTTALVSVYAFIGNLFSTRYLLEAMVLPEIIFTSILFFTRYLFIKRDIGFGAGLAVLLSAISFFLANNSSIYPAGELINQQVVVLVSLSILHLYLSKKYLAVSILILLCIPFHTIASFILTALMIAHFALQRITKMLNTNTKYIVFWLLAHIPLLIVLLPTMSEVIRDAIGAFLLPRTNQIYTLEILNKSLDWRIISLQNSFGPILLALFMVSTLITLKKSLNKYLWISLFATYTIGLTFAVFPFFGRFSSLSAVPIVIMIGVLLMQIFQKKLFVYITLIVVIVSSLFVLPYFRQYDNLASEYFNKGFIDKYELDAIAAYPSKSNFKSVINNPSSFSLVTDYITKHMATINYGKYDDKGLFENDSTKRLQMRDYLKGAKDDMCATLGTPYVLEIISDRSLNFSRFNNYNTLTQLNNVWNISSQVDAQVITQIQEFDLNYDSQSVLENISINNVKFRLLQCPTK